MANPGISQLISTTLESQIPNIIDNITNGNVLLTKLKEKGNLIKNSGGNSIRETMNYASNGTVQFQGEYDTFDTTPADVITSADFSHKILTGTTTMTGLEMKQNAGKEQIINLLDGKFKALRASLANQMGSSVYADGTGSGGQEIGGLQLLVADDPTTGTVGGIDRSTSGGTFFRNQLWDASVESVTLSATTIASAMNALFMRCQAQGNEAPDLIMADAVYFGYYEDSLQTIQRVNNPDLGKLGFNTIKYKNADVAYDSACPASHMYFLNTNHIFLKYIGKEMFEIGETVRPVNQDVYITPLIFTGNMTITNARVHGVIIN
jgi:hypothetical protein